MVTLVAGTGAGWDAIEMTGQYDRMRALVRDFEQSSGRPRALLFDLDGTLADSMQLHYEAYRLVFAAEGRTFSEKDFFDRVGPPARDVIPAFMRSCGMDADSGLGWRDVHARKKEELDALLRERSPKKLEALGILQDSADTAKLAVVTSGNRRGAEAILRSLDIFERLDVLITSDDVERGKPDPEPFRKALHELGVAADHALAFEDHAAGIRSATAAGLHVIDVVNECLVAPDEQATAEASE